MSWYTQSNATTVGDNQGSKLDRRAALSIGVRANAGINAQTLDAWREQAWLLLSSTSPELHREVLCGRMSLRAAAAELEIRKVWLDRRGHRS